MTDHETLLASLNPAQREAVTAGDGPTLVLAGPGSGKTRVLTHRVAYLVAVAGVEPWRIMAVTFTNKAAREMRGRTEDLVGEGALRRLTLGTFHAICARILRVEAEAAGIPRDFAIFDQDDQLALVRRALADVGLDAKTYPPRAVLGVIGQAKNELVRPGSFRADSYWHEKAGRAYERYQALLHASRALDFDDLLLEAADLLRRDDATRARYVRRYRHVLVDEFQDTNTAQYALLKLLAAADEPEASHNLFVVGDEDQSIYRWRGADFRNVLRFRRDFTAARVILLEQNYRSTQTILDAARAVIDRNRERTPKRLWTEAGRGEPITMFEAYDGDEEAAFVVREIEGGTRGGSPYGDYAVMYRTNAQSRAVEDACVRRGIPYQLVGATRFYDRREIKDSVAYLRLVHNPFDEVSLARIINVPARGIGPRTWDALVHHAAEMKVPYWTALEIVASDEPVAGVPPMDRRAASPLTAFHDLVRELVAARDHLGPDELLAYVTERSGYREHLRDGTEEGDDRWANVEELLAAAAEFADLPPSDGLTAFLESVALVSDVDNLSGERDRVTLLTLHAAKGLEFSTVFLVGMEENLLPHSRSTDDLEAMAEERRLFYVGLTRARRKVYLTHAFRRVLFGRSEPRERSRFLDDVPHGLVDGGTRKTDERPGSRFRDTRWEPVVAPPEPRGASGGAVAASGAAFRPGDKVLHTTFGRGVVVSSVVRDGDEQVTVAFIHGGVKKLLQSFAKLQPA